eukprot:gene11275-4088_t
MSNNNENMSKLRVVKLKISQRISDSKLNTISEEDKMVEENDNFFDFSPTKEAVYMTPVESPTDLTKKSFKDQFRDFTSKLTEKKQNKEHQFMSKPTSPVNGKSPEYNFTAISLPNSPHHSRSNSPHRRSSNSPPRGKSPRRKKLQGSNAPSETSETSKKRTSSEFDPTEDLREFKPTKKRLSLPEIYQITCSNCKLSNETCLEGYNSNCRRCENLGLVCNRESQDKRKSMGFYSTISLDHEFGDFDIDLLENMDLLDLNEEITSPFINEDDFNTFLTTRETSLSFDENTKISPPQNQNIGSPEQNQNQRNSQNQQERQISPETNVNNRKKNKWNKFDEYLSNELKSIASAFNLKKGKDTKEKKEILRLENLIVKQKQQIAELKAKNISKRQLILQTKPTQSVSTPFSTGFEKSSLPMMFVSLQGQILSINRTCAEMFNFSPEEISKKVISLSDIVHSEDFDSFLQKF